MDAASTCGNSAKHERTVGVASTINGTARYTSNERTRCALGTKRVVPSVLDLLKASHKTHKPVPKAISFAQDATEVSPALAVGLVFQVHDCHARWRVVHGQKIQVDGAIDTPPASAAAGPPWMGYYEG